MTTAPPVLSAVAPLLRLANADTRAPLVTGGDTRYIDLDAAASTPPMAAVQQALTEALPFYASVHRGAGWSSQVSTAAYEHARADVGSFVGAHPDDVVVFTRNTTDALLLLAGAVPGAVLHLDLEHHANQLPWRRGAHRVVPVRPTWADTLAALDAALREGTFALLSVSGASNVTGECPPLPEVVGLARRHGVRVAVDGAQLVPHRPVDLAALGVDYLAFSGHKMYAPYGSGALVGRRDWLDAAAPHQPGGGAVARVGVDDVEWLVAPARHEGGTPNVLGAIALAAACRTIAELRGRVAHEHDLRQRLQAGLRGLGLTPARVWPDDDLDTVGVVAFSVPGIDSAHVAAWLSAEHGIGLRDGRFCAHPLLDRLSGGDALLRASVGLGTGSDDVDALLGALGVLLSDGPRWRYERTTSGVVPVPDPRPRPAFAPPAPPVPGCEP